MLQLRALLALKTRVARLFLDTSRLGKRTALMRLVRPGYDIRLLTPRSLVEALSLGNATKRIEACLSKGHVDKALKLSAGILAADPENSFVWHLLARACHASGDETAAAAAFAKALASDPNDIDLKRRLGIAAASVGDHETAIVLLDDVKRYISDDTVVVALLRAYRDTGRWRETQALTIDLLDGIDGMDQLPISKGVAAKIWHAYLRAAVHFTEADFATVRELIEDGELERADAILERLTDEFALFPNVWFELGRVRRRQGAHDSAVVLFEQSIAACRGDSRYAVTELFEQLNDDETLFLIASIYSRRDFDDRERKWIAKVYEFQRDHVLDSADAHRAIVKRIYTASRSERLALLLIDLNFAGERWADVVTVYHDAVGAGIRFKPGRADKLNMKYCAAVDHANPGALEAAHQMVTGGDFAGAVQRCDAIIARYPYVVDAYFVRAQALHDMGRFDEAKAAFFDGLEIGADVPKRLRHAVIERLTGTVRALIVNDFLANSQPRPSDFHWLAEHYYKRHEWGTAESYYLKANVATPDDRNFLFKIIRIKSNLGKELEALDISERVLSKFPNDTEVLRIRGDVLMAVSCYRDAAQNYKKAIALRPDIPYYRARLSRAYLIEGDIRRGLALVEARREVSSFIAANKVYPFQPWEGELSTIKRVLVWHEHGFGVGQNILYSSFLNLLAEIGVDVVVEVEERLVPVYRRSFPNIEVVTTEHATYEARTDIGYHTPIGSLARWFRSDVASFADYRRFFRTDAERVDAVRSALKAQAPSARAFVGISWTSTNPFVGDKKSIDLELLLSALNLDDVQLVNLQYGDHEEAIHAAVNETGVSLVPSGVDNTNDLDGLAAVIEAVDLVVSIGHTTAHLAGAVGQRNFILLPASPFIHWMAEGEPCLWYANATLIRKAPSDTDWSAVLSETRRRAADYLGLESSSTRKEGHRIRNGLEVGGPSTVFAPGRLQGSLAEAQISHGALLPAASQKPVGEDDASPLALQNAVDGFAARGALRSAIALLERNVSAHGHTASSRMQMVDLLMAAGRWRQAEDVLSALAADEPDCTGVTSREIVQRQYDLALVQYDLECALKHNVTLRELGHDTYGLTLAAISLLHKIGRLDEAKIMSRALSLAHTPTAEWAVIHARLVFDLGCVDDAEAVLAPFASAAARSVRDTDALAQDNACGDTAAEHGGALSRLPRYWRARAGVQPSGLRSMRLGAIVGDGPSCAANDIVLFVVADNMDFWDRARTLIASIAANSPGAKVHLHLINPDPTVAVEVVRLRQKWPQIDLSLTSETLDLGTLTPQAVALYKALTRLVRLADISRAAPAIYVCVDSHCLVRGPIDAIRADLADFDIMVAKRFVADVFFECVAGGLVVAPTGAARRALDWMVDAVGDVFDAGEIPRFLDCLALDGLIEIGTREGLRTTLLDGRYVDGGCEEESVIWVDRNERAFQNRDYFQEANRYRDCLGDAQ